MIPVECIRDAIEQATGTRPSGEPVPVGGGCISDTHKLGDFFVKSGAASQLDMFEAEQRGLEEIASTGTVRVPAPVCCAAHDQHAFLVMEHLPLTHAASASQEHLGRALAGMHRVTQDSFGWDIDNFIGATAQPNPRGDDWITFLRDHRLGHMLTLAQASGHRFRNAERLLDHLEMFFAGYDPVPSLLHGDLWGGNASALPDGTPVIFDPAVYFGDREADLAMTTLFGGFSTAFYDAYNDAWPLDPGHHRRRSLYNLYHILNHAVLFGGSYAHQARSMIDGLVERI